jgi:hypothetical protein
MKENFQISEGDPLEFSLAISQNNGVCLFVFFYTFNCFYIRIYHMLFELNYYRKRI